MRKFLISWLTVLIFACVGQSAIVDVGIVIVDGEDGSLVEEAGILQDIIDAGGVFTSPATVTIDDILVRNLASFAVIWRDEGDFGFPFQLTLTDARFFSDDSGGTFDNVGGLFASDIFDGSLQRGFYKGPDGILWTADDVEIIGSFDPMADAMVLFGPAVSIADTLANRVYYESEVEFVIESQYIVILSGDGNITSTTVIIPEPASMVLFALGMLCVIRRS